MQTASFRFFTAVLSASLIAGCGDANDTRPVLSPPSEDMESSSVPTIALVSPDGIFLESNIWEQIFRLRSGRGDVLTEVLITPAGSQAETLRGLTTRGFSVAVVVPDPTDPAVPDALAALRDSGLPLLILHKPVQVPGPPIPFIGYSSLDADAGRLVEAARADAIEAGFPPEGPGVVVTNGPFDEDGQRRVEALERAMKDAGIRVLPTVAFRGFVDQGKAAIEALLAQHPEVAIILTEDEQGARSASAVRNELPKDQRKFQMAIFGWHKELQRMSQFNIVAALAQRDPELLAKAAFKAALELARGAKLPESTEVATLFTRRTGPELEGYMIARPAGPVTSGVPAFEQEAEPPAKDKSR